MANRDSPIGNWVGNLLSMVLSWPARPWILSPVGLTSVLLGGAVLLVSCRLTYAQLKPDEIAIIAMRQSRASRDVAEYYAAARSIPPSHICLIDGKPGAALRRSEWEVKVRPAIRRWIFAHQLETKLRCLVTVWDVPLKIGKQPADLPEIRDRTAYLQGEQQARTQRLIQRIDQVNRLSRGGRPPAPPSQPLNSSAADLANQLQAAVRASQQRLAKVKPGEEGREAAFTSLQQAVLAGGGIRAILQAAHQAAALEKDSDSAAHQQTQSQMDVIQGRLQGLRVGLDALQALPPSVQRDERVLSLVEQSEGLLGTLKWIETQLKILDKNETYASFDSELSLLFWPAYQLDRWQPNVLHYRFDGSRERWLKATLMVSRLEAPTLQLTTRLIDTAKQVEARGLQGKVYLDSRGFGRPSGAVAPGSYVDYDLSIQTLAADLKRHTSLDVVLDTKNGLFQAGECPQAALYCGWYSLAKYVDAFDWVPGSVGYHIASGEASTLRSPKSQVWCKRMLEDGVCATLGPVHEPYLTAFPRPDEFFLLLASGQYTLVETYYRTKPFNSWVMTLIGDPLYNPFKNNPPLQTKVIPDAWRRLFGQPSSAAPSAP